MKIPSRLGWHADGPHARPQALSRVRSPNQRHLNPAFRKKLRPLGSRSAVSPIRAGAFGPDQEHSTMNFKTFSRSLRSDGWRERVSPGIHACLDCPIARPPPLIATEIRNLRPQRFIPLGIASRVSDYCGATPDGARPRSRCHRRAFPAARPHG